MTASLPISALGELNSQEILVGSKKFVIRELSNRTLIQLAKLAEKLLADRAVLDELGSGDFGRIAGAVQTLMATVPDVFLDVLALVTGEAREGVLDLTPRQAMYLLGVAWQVNDLGKILQTAAGGVRGVATTAAAPSPIPPPPPKP